MISGYKKKFVCDKFTNLTACNPPAKDACSVSTYDTCVLKAISDNCPSNGKSAANFGCQQANVGLQINNCPPIDCAQFNTPPATTNNTVLQCYTPYFAALNVVGNPPSYSTYKAAEDAKLNSNVNAIDDFCKPVRTLVDCVTDAQATANVFNAVFGANEGPSYLADYKVNEFTCSHVAGYKLLFTCNNQTKASQCNVDQSSNCTQIISTTTCHLLDVKTQCDNDAAVFGCEQANVGFQLSNCKQIDCKQFNNSGFSNLQFALIPLFISAFSRFLF
uniref:Uncharacterized protein n=1 Tax=Panagrolaimus sp. JU765 TaxID=591449 RepID=A0AC34RDD1_9BILA